MKEIRLVLIWILTFFLTGCWNRIEINDIAIVTAIGLDLVEDDMILLSLQVAIPSKLGATSGSGGESEKGSLIISDTGVTISEAFRNIQGKLPRRIFFSQSRVLLIGEDLAKKGVTPIVNFHTRYSKTRINSFIMFTKGEASTVINSLPKFENVSADEIKELGKLNIGLKVYIMDFFNMILTDGLEPYAPLFTLEELEVNTKHKSDRVQSINGTAVFKGDKLIGWMNKIETRGLLWLRNEIESGIVTVKIPEEQGGGNISMEIAKSNTKVEPKLVNGHLKININVTPNLNLIENDSHLDLFNSKVLEDLQTKVNKRIEGRLQATVDTAQKKYQSDILGFGYAVYQKYPKEWATIYKKNWDQEFPQLDVKIHSKASIRRIGLTK
ncbi:Ger(x)C family spore germination protein [Bacillus sp. USDA818B3_A]|uniref:Ger(x)C family spore germination protein n=1 Tax=Bacillus sp. USDA818B3_A TaxID=2698834 RepID=UPI001368B474|nr:Ger(x)C family spore germination protein [Bacillus sp. USDA818B3_A]